jgi:hypothetical protein
VELEQQLRHIGVLAALNVRWPHLVDRLLSPPVENPTEPLVIEQFVAGNGSDPRPASFDWLPLDLRDFLEAHREALDIVVRLTNLEPAGGAALRMSSTEQPIPG